jgi:predicted ATPase
MNTPQLIGLREELRLFGRDSEIQQIQDAVQRSTTGAEFVLVHGESGTGKTSLVQHALINQKENMVSGKFDVMNKTRPYSAIVDALSELCQRKLAGNSDKCEQLKAKLASQLCANDIRMLTKLVPSLVLFFAPQDDQNGSIECGGSVTDDLSVITTACDVPNKTRGSNAFARFAEVMRLFLHLACSDDDHLILFLDDIQWADSASVALIASLASHADSLNNILIVLAYRDDEEYGLTPSQILPRKIQLPVTDINLSRLDFNGLNDVVSKVLQMGNEETMGLTEIILQRTGGNVYFCVQFLEMLRRESLLTFSFQHVRWEWNEKQIQAGTDVTDNVAMLLTGKIRHLPKELQSILQLAACLGFYFHVEFLEKLATSEGICANENGCSSDEHTEQKEATNDFNFMELLELGCKENLIERVNDSLKYKFTHDRAQQAAYEMIPAGRDRDLLHWRIGKLLLKEQQDRVEHASLSSSSTADDWILFAATDQLNRGSSVAHELIVTEADRLALVDLNIEAGKKAVEKSAFSPGAEFFGKAIQLLGSRWETEYDLCLEIYTLSSQAEYAVSNFTACDHRVQVILANARSIVDKFPAYVVWVESLIVRRKLLEATDLAVDVLRLLGERIPRKPNLLQLIWEITKAKQALKKRKLTDLMELRPMTNPNKIMAMELLLSLSSAAWFSSQKEIMAFGYARMPRLTFTYGMCQHSPFSVALYGLLQGIMGDYEMAYESGQVALQLLKRLPSKACHSQTINVVFCFLKHIKEPLTRSLDPLLESYHTGLEMGEVEAAAIGLAGYGSLGALLGKKLEDVVKELESFRDTYQEEYEQNFMMIMMIPFHQFSLNLLGRSENPLVLTGESMNEDAYLRGMIVSRNDTGENNVYIVRMMLLYIMSEVKGALKELNKLDFEIIAKGTHFVFYFVCTYSGLILLGRARETRKRKYIRRAEKYIRMMTKFAKAGSVNAPPFLGIMLAEKTSLNRKSSNEEVKTAYDKVIALSARCGLVLIQAIANERAGEFFYTLEDMFWAETYLSRAFILYKEWGAIAKTSQMRRNYQFLDTSEFASSLISSSVTLRSKFTYKEIKPNRPVLDP